MTRFLTYFAKAALRLFPAYPSEEYVPLDQITMEGALRRAAEEFEDEASGGLLRFFRSRPIDGEAVAVDLGCGFGGRTVQYERILGCRMVGLEIDPRMLAPARSFAQSREANRTHFVVGIGEALPLADSSVDLILCYDVLEHVEDPARCLAECSRVLKPGGRLRLVFPPYFHPTGAHLEGYVSRAPYANLLFPAPVLLRAIDEILEERGGDYRPQPLRPGDRLYCLNGLSIAGFKRLLKAPGLKVITLEFLPLFSKANRKYDSWKMRYYAWCFRLLARTPLLQECCVHRIVAELEWEE